MAKTISFFLCSYIILRIYMYYNIYLLVITYIIPFISEESKYNNHNKIILIIILYILKRYIKKDINNQEKFIIYL